MSAALSTALLAATALPELAQDNYPSKTIRFVVPYPPGGNLGSADVAKQAPADGYTLLLAASGPMAVNPTLYRSMPFVPMTDLAPVIQISSFLLVLEVHPSVAVNTVKELVALAVTSAKRHPSLPNVPTMMEAGIAGYELTGWHGIAVRAGTPAPIVQKLNTTLNAIFNEPEFKKKWEAIGTPVVGGTSQQFGELIRKETTRLGQVVKNAGVTVD